MTGPNNTASPIYRMFYSRWKEAWYALSPQEQQTLRDEVQSEMTKVQGELILLCDPSWASEKWSSWGVEKFPSLEALQGYTACLVAMNWYRYCEVETLLGTRLVGIDGV